MHFPKQLAQLAQQRALSGFATLTEHMLAEAEASMAQAARTSAGDELAALSSARSLVRFDGQALREQMRQHFALLLERAMQTMHTDLRAGLRAVRADELSLMDDTVMDRQILVDRLLVRLRDVDQLSLGRLNVIIAQLHGVSEVRERENPFRPWLLARALYEAVSAMVRDELRIRILFQHLSMAMAAHLNLYYGAVLEVFEQRGVIGRLSARPSQLTRAERERLAWQRAAEAVAQPAGAGGVAGTATGTATGTAPGASALLPTLRQMMSGAPQVASAFPDIDGFDEAQALRALVRKMGAQDGAARARAHAARAGAPPARAETPGPQLLEALRGAQRASLERADEQSPLQLARLIATNDVARSLRQRIELTALLFEFMLEDRLLDAGLRAHVGRLFVPFVRVVLADGALPVQADHAARRLVDRIGQVVAALDADTDAVLRAALTALVERTVDDVLRRFDGDPAVIDSARADLDEAVGTALRASDGRHAACMAAIDEAGALHGRAAAAQAALAPLLTPLRSDPRIENFLHTTWAQVMARGAPDEGGHAGLLADLVWSAQAKLDAGEHTALMRMLPGLVKRLREGIARLGLPDAHSKMLLDQLVAVHMDVMANRQDPLAGGLGLDVLRHYFAPIEERAALAHDTGTWLAGADLAPALARHGAVAALQAEPPQLTATPEEDALLASFQPGMGVEFLEGGIYVTGRLVAVGQAGGVFLFAVPGLAAPPVYLRAALLAALRDDQVRALEYAPLFARAVAGLTVSAEALAS